MLSQSISGTSFASGSTDTLTATIEDAQGNTVTTGSDATASITFAQTNSGTGAGSVTGLGSATASGGVATKTTTGNLAGAVNLQASGTINATATTSNTLNDTVTAGPVAKIVFTTQPDGSATVNARFPTQPVVTAEDAAGNTVGSYSKTITLSIATGPVNAALTGCSGSLSGGVDTFSGCQVSTAGSYTLKATDTSSPALTATSNSFVVSSVSATSVAEATGPSPSLATPSITPVSGATYLMFVYCSGQKSDCNGTSAQASVSSPAFSSATFDEAVGTGTSKDCLEVFTAKGTTTSGAVTVSGASGQNIGFVNVVQLSPNAQVLNGPTFPSAQGSSSPATAGLTNPPANDGELIPIAVADGNGQTGISVQTPTNGMNLLGAAQQDGTVGADMSVYFDSVAQSNPSFPLNPTTPLNGWATFAIEVG